MKDCSTCDKCECIEESIRLSWIDCEDFEPLAKDKFSQKKYQNALKKGYSALCEDCYKEECCENE